MLLQNGIDQFKQQFSHAFTHGLLAAINFVIGANLKHSKQAFVQLSGCSESCIQNGFCDLFIRNHASYFKLIVVFTPVLTAASSNHRAVTVFTCV